MTQQTQPVHRSLHRLRLQLLLVQSLSWLGVFSFLSSNSVLAQTSPSLDAATEPTIDNPQPIVKSAPITPQIAPAPVRLEPKPALARQAQLKLQVSTAPAPVKVPIRSLPQAATNLHRQVQAQSPRLVRTPVKPATDYSNAYIDPTSYNIGASSGYVAPNRVVISERSTGCQAVLRGGQGLPGSLCGTRRATVALRGTQSINNFRVPRAQALNLALRNQAVAVAVAPVRRSPAVAVTGMAPVRLGPLTVSVNGLSATQRPPASVPSQMALGTMSWPVQSSANEYSPTIQPIVLPSSVSTGMMFPLTIPAMITSVFGWRMSPISGSQQFHAGTDLGAPLGTPVLAAYPGNVAIANLLGGYGLAVVLDHQKLNEQTLYGHLSEIFVQPGQWVEQGTVIGRVGSTGNSTGPHLHFEIRQQTPEGWVATDPGDQLKYALAQLVQTLHTAQAPQPQSSGQGG